MRLGVFGMEKNRPVAKDKFFHALGEKEALGRVNLLSGFRKRGISYPLTLFRRSG